MKKKNAYIIGLLSILFLTLFSVYIDKPILIEIIPSSIAGIIGIALAYVAGNRAIRSASTRGTASYPITEIKKLASI